MGKADMIEKRDLTTVARALIPFFWTQRISGYAVPDMPRFEEDGAGYFEKVVRQSSFYLEYGSGGSTVLAARLKKRFISVDSDKYFLRAVQRRIGTLSPGQLLIHSNVGLNGPWGIPIFKRKTETRLLRWGKYPEAPWRAIFSNDLGLPDLIMIDGRFRVACALTCFKYLKESSRAIMLVDDYANRPHLQVIEDFAALEDIVGRMAVFRAKSYSEPKLKECLSHYLSDWR